MRGGCNLKCGKLENGKLECILVSKNVKTGSPKRSNGKLDLVSKTAISKMVLGTKSYLHYKPSQ